ncbi:MAG: carboxypeptidase-like regulatory domain-containing protein [Flammeovirgaceae bacterium]|nr:carboxypeptidase-like regulatory domain-containing protein [Flammeovirgaceae bacterium]MDW8286490.1 carboxypeptidase-like regulatory domain-containing protein [Flammeovirgaceae bacterium]
MVINKLILFSWLLTLLFTFSSYAQEDISEKRVSIKFDSLSLSEALDKLGRRTGMVMFYSADLLPKDKIIHANYTRLPITYVLEDLLTGTGLEWKVEDRDIIIKKSGAKFTVKGRVADLLTGEDLIGASIAHSASNIGIISNQYGFYSITLPSGTNSLSFSYVGYKKEEFIFRLVSDTTINIYLEPEQRMLDEVVVYAENTQQLNLNKIESSFKLNADFVRDAPSFLGEEDLMRAFQLLPGIQGGTEGQAGLFVRGGSNDQNLILMDDAPVYAVSHIFGLFSIFNPDVVKDVEVFKGGISAKYGGRLSSVVDVKLKEGNKNVRTISGSVGSIASRLTIEQPLSRHSRGAMVFSARRSYMDLLLRAIPDNENIFTNALYFYDTNLKANYMFNDRNKLSLSAYLGRDVTGVPNVLSNSWGNNVASLRWHRVYSPKLFSTLTAYVTHFSTRTLVNFIEKYGYTTRYSLRDFGVKNDFSYYARPDLRIDFGGELIQHRYLFGEIIPFLKEDSFIQPRGLAPFYAQENGLYVQADYNLSKKTLISGGLRYSYFAHVGQGKKYVYNTEQVIAPSTSEENIIGEVNYAHGKVIASYRGIEPRFSLRYLLNSKNAVKISYNRTRQYIHQLSNTNTPLPYDMWMPVNAYIRPQLADHFSGGFFRNFLDNTWETSIEAFYKDLQHQIDFKPTAQLILNDHLETEILQGIGKAYGVELFIRKQRGKTTGWLSYYLARTERKIDGINRNRPYPTSFDRTHNLSLVVNHQVSRRVSFSANWVFASGLAFTFPVAKYEFDGFLVPYYTNRNGYRLPTNHRLDISMTFFRSKTSERKNESSFNFSVYNVYARRNTFAYVFRQNKQDRSKTEAVKLYLFSIIPSFTYHFKF